MKVLQINTVCGYGSTGRTSIELAESLQNHGHKCYIAYGQGSTNYVNSFKIGTVLENHFHNISSRLTGKQGYFTKDGTKKLIRYINDIKPDVIHLRNLHGNYLNLEILFGYLSKVAKPIVWTLHDCWAFTGKCAHYTDIGCYKWQTYCSHCPQVSTYPPSFFFDRSKLMFRDKKNWFTSVANMTIVPVSNWLAEETNKSFLGKYPIVPIYNWVDHSIFKPSKSDAKAKYRIDKSKFVILGVSASWKKNSSKLQDFIRLSQLVSEEMQIVLLGNTEGPACIPSNIVHIPYIHSTSELAEIYTIANVYVHLSAEDTFGKVIAEAISCGTPAIVYDATACPELIGEGCGYVVAKRDFKAICLALHKIQIAGKQKYLGRCIQHARENYDFAENTEKIIKLYKSVLIE